MSDASGSHESWMRRAIDLARGAALGGDVPVGAVLVSGAVVVDASNCKERHRDPSAHAEILVIREAARRLGTWRLSEATIYVTKEPCVMCAGAMVAARLRCVVYGCADPKGGAAGSVLNVLDNPALNHRVEVVSGVLESETAAQLQAFFRSKRM